MTKAPSLNRAARAAVDEQLQLRRAGGVDGRPHVSLIAPSDRGAAEFVGDADRAFQLHSLVAGAQRHAHSRAGANGCISARAVSGIGPPPWRSS